MLNPYNYIADGLSTTNYLPLIDYIQIAAGIVAILWLITILLANKKGE